MDKSDAQKLLSDELARFGTRSHSELAPLVESQHVEISKARSSSGTTYHVEIQFFWDDRPGDTIRIVGSIDDGGFRAFVPLTDALLIVRTEGVSA